MSIDYNAEFFFGVQLDWNEIPSEIREQLDYGSVDLKKGWCIRCIEPFIDYYTGGGMPDTPEKGKYGLVFELKDEDYTQESLSRLQIPWHNFSIPSEWREKTPSFFVCMSIWRSTPVMLSSM